MRKPPRYRVTPYPPHYYIVEVRGWLWWRPLLRTRGPSYDDPTLFDSPEEAECALEDALQGRGNYAPRTEVYEVAVRDGQVTRL